MTSVFSASVSVGIIIQLLESPSQRLPLSEIFHRCVSIPFRERAEFLIRSGLVIKVNDRYEITKAGVTAVRFFQKFQNLFGMTSQGFYSSEDSLAELHRKKMETN